MIRGEGLDFLAIEGDIAGGVEALKQGRKLIVGERLKLTELRHTAGAHPVNGAEEAKGHRVREHSIHARSWCRSTVRHS